MIKDPNNKVVQDVSVRVIKGGVERVKYALHDAKNRELFFAFGVEENTFSSNWVVSEVYRNGQKQPLSEEQSSLIFKALSLRYATLKKEEIVLKEAQRKI